MMVKNNKALEKLLNLKEDYRLNLNNYKDVDDLRFNEDETEDDSKVETQDDEAEGETEDKEVEDDESSDEGVQDDSQEKKPQETPTPDKKEEPVKSDSSEKAHFVVELAPFYNKMKDAKTPADVGLALKAFLKEMQSKSVDELTKISK